MTQPQGRDEEEAPRVVIRDTRRIDPDTGQTREPVGEYSTGSPDPAASAGTPPPAAGSPPSEPRSDDELAERTADLQRVSAEYANYRRRVERDRVAVAEVTQDRLLAGLLPVLDDIDRAREHGDLDGAFKAVAEQLVGVLVRAGLEAFGDPGDAFDPSQHEAVMHSTSADVDGPTCIAVMRRGYRRGERLLRPAMVAVADPEHPTPDTPAPVTGE